MQAKRQTHAVRDALIDAKAVNFDAIAKVVAQYGPTAAQSLDYEDVFCGTMRRYIWVYHVPTVGTPVEDLGELAQGAEQLE